MSGDGVYNVYKVTTEAPSFSDDRLTDVAFNSLMVLMLLLVFTILQISKKCKKFVQRYIQKYRAREGTNYH